jgi:hypothetical protein
MPQIEFAKVDLSNDPNAREEVTLATGGRTDKVNRFNQNGVFY